MRPQRRMNFIRDRYAKKWLIGASRERRPASPARPALAGRAYSRSDAELAGGDLVTERVGVEAVEPAPGPLGLRGHEEPDRLPGPVRPPPLSPVVVCEQVLPPAA